MNKPLIEPPPPPVSKVHPTDSTTNNISSNCIPILNSTSPTPSSPQTSHHNQPLIISTASTKYGGSNTSVYSSIEKLLASSKDFSHYQSQDYNKGNIMSNFLY
jgi:hypothetical protein